jgi:hypothetical protein
VLLGNIDISNDGAFTVSSDPRERKDCPRATENCQQMAGAVSVVPQQYYLGNCHRFYEVWKDGLDLITAHSNQAHICNKVWG